MLVRVVIKRLKHKHYKVAVGPVYNVRLGDAGVDVQNSEEQQYERKEMGMLRCLGYYCEEE